MSNNLSKEVDIGKLFNEFSFRVPIYQRNYAWGEDEIGQLLKDINDIDKNKNYYLGTLVLYNNADYQDVIDGQQRLTTLYLLNKILAVRSCDVAEIKNQLAFESRPKTTEFFKALFEKESIEAIEQLCNETKELDNFLVAINEINKFIEQDLKGNIKEFKEKFLKNTFLFTTELPGKTDVNHYFEIMNNRGEQLEKHEILKAEFLNKLEDRYNKEKFAKIWEANSQMDNHVQYYFNMEARKTLFDENLNSFPTDEKIEAFLINKNEKGDLLFEKTNEDDVQCGIEILNTYQLPNQFKQDLSSTHVEKFKSIIDFENFLLQVLSLLQGFEDTNLDDKNLLKNFGYDSSKDILFPNSITFIKKLLQVRFIFDKYIVKREINENQDNAWQWVIRSFSSYDKSFVQNNTFSDEYWSEKLVMLQSMFQVSYFPNVNKTWLRDLLNYLCNDTNTDAQSIYDFLMNAMKNRYIDSGFNTDQGLQTPRAVFNFLDYLLWEEYYEHIRGQEDVKNQKIDAENKNYLGKISNLKNNFKSFRFTQRNSIEHFFPQSKIDDLTVENANETDENRVGIINSFGNLCLISSSSNSSYNKEHPSFKKSKGRSKNESLKQQLMFESMDEDSWGQKEIEKHQKEMMQLMHCILRFKI